MNGIIWWIQNRFQSVQHLGSDLLSQHLAQDRNQVVLLDVRSLAEYEVSHLEGAIHVDPETSDMEQLVNELGLAGRAANSQVVCYCTVGYRSCMLAKRLAPFLPSLRVYNLEGGLVKWANERRSIVDSREQPTRLVHPYSSTWTYLLKPAFRAQI
ncbi:tRNA uridine(34) hydroxylase-like [Narcine bancroftii]|uniref:tRNA uridine(34) hydroxylase-like n=1 Tax=Narcine bancroftii TaxID=1343680 RepID=UPI0038316A41